MKITMKTIIIYSAIVVGLILIDQLTKIYAFKYFEIGPTYPCIPHVVKFKLLYNDGAIGGIFSGQRWIFYIATVLGLGLFGYMLKSGNVLTYPLYTFGLLLMIGGTFGNFIDRIFIHEVRDFITFDIFTNFKNCAFLRSSFNFADMCMTVGVIMLIIDIVFGKAGSQWQ